MKIFLILVLFINFSFSQRQVYESLNVHKELLSAFENVIGNDYSNAIGSDNKTIFDIEYGPRDSGDGKVSANSRSIFVSINSAKLVYFYGNSFSKNRRYDLTRASEILKQDEFDNEKPTLLYIHGYTESLESESIRVVSDAYFKRNDHNVIILDWSKLAQGTYFASAVPNAFRLAGPLAEAVLDLIQDGLDIERLHVVGHSLGGQLAGALGRNIKEKSYQTKKLFRISALDPAFPGFYPSTVYKALNKFDAKFVDVIHTNGMEMGAPVSTGSVDFWPNSGKNLQPGCGLGIRCSHHRSWRFWAETVESNKGKIFPAVKCASWSDFKARKCDFDEVTYMGIDCPTNVFGDYYLETNADTPYAKGLNGVKYY
ncbi:hypothetical protein PVAND_017082 [Polypedilum vanderplanki]|uniref:Lipase domain-containing protein n=1 Tax=Polypedilum vanderplanki TaxID=319348 RepID=A0A9J6BH75_POLVA|nr:hypothetical protein PVAND_017082 [Polypedilum vanderplanki]